MATSTTSVPLCTGPLPDVEALDAALAALARRFPRAEIGRYLARLPQFGARVLVAPTAAVIGAGSVVGAGALVTAKTVVPPRSLVLGAPARVIRALAAEDEEHHRALAAKYVRLKENYLRDALRCG